MSVEIPNLASLPLDPVEIDSKKEILLRMERIEAKLDRLITPMLTDAEAKARLRALFAEYYGEREL